MATHYGTYATFPGHAKFAGNAMGGLPMSLGGGGGGHETQRAQRNRTGRLVVFMSVAAFAFWASTSAFFAQVGRSVGLSACAPSMSSCRIS